MEWTAEQVDEMRVGRPSYGDRDQGAALTWLRSAKETSGEYSLLYVEFGPSYTVFPHYHTHYMETFKILEGIAEGRVGNRRISAGAGEEIVVPPGTVHGWGPITQPGRGIVELRPAHEGVEKWLVMLHNMHDAGLTKPDLQPYSFVHGALFAVASDTHLVGPTRVLNPIFKAVAWIARRAGVDKQLEQKYFQPSAGGVAAT